MQGTGSWFTSSTLGQEPVGEKWTVGRRKEEGDQTQMSPPHYTVVSLSLRA